MGPLNVAARDGDIDFSASSAKPPPVSAAPL